MEHTKIKRDYSPELEESTKKQYSVVLVGCAIIIFGVIAFGAFVAHSHWDVISRALS